MRSWGAEPEVLSMVRSVPVLMPFVPSPLTVACSVPPDRWKAFSVLMPFTSSAATFITSVPPLIKAWPFSSSVASFVHDTSMQSPPTPSMVTWPPRISKYWSMCNPSLTALSTSMVPVEALSRVYSSEA